MKLDEKYFERKVEIIGKIVNREYLHNGTIGGILHQIARDGAEAQKVAIKLALIDAVETCSIPIKFSEIVAAIKSATVKEVPGV